MDKIIINGKEYERVKNSTTKGLADNTKSTCKPCDVAEKDCNGQCGSIVVTLKLINKEPITELTLDEVATKFNKDVKDIRIKD